jgi:phosphoribosylformimino-5-aminoimidazole carboxamide ribotide isomerase
MLEGIDLEEVARTADAVGEGGRLTYSGGVGSLADLSGLAALKAPNLKGVIVGKALYEERFTIAEAHAALGSARAGSTGPGSPPPGSTSPGPGPTPTGA